MSADERAPRAASEMPRESAAGRASPAAEPARASGRVDPGSGKPLPGPLLAGPKPLAQASGRTRSRSRRALTALAALAVRALERVLVASVRVRVVEGADELARLAERAPAECAPWVLAFWHEALAPGLVFLGTRQARALGRQAVLVSPSIDGDLAARVLERGGRRVVRGSATRSGVKALRDLHKVAQRERVSPLVLPDGPRGPAREAKLGPVLLAQLGRAPLVPLGFALRPALRLGTWDRLLVPLPFARLDVALGAPLAPPATMDAAELERHRAALERELTRLAARAARG